MKINKVITMVLITVVMAGLLVIGSRPSTADTGINPVKAISNSVEAELSTQVEKVGGITSMSTEGQEVIPVTIVPESALRYVGE